MDRLVFASFIVDLRDRCPEANPFNDRELLFDDKVAISVEVGYFSDIVTITGIRSLDRGKGHASRALKFICELLDKHNLRGYLVACPFGSSPGRLSAAQLQSWYNHYGFYGRGDDCHLTRHPRSGWVKSMLLMKPESVVSYSYTQPQFHQGEIKYEDA